VLVLPQTVKVKWHYNNRNWYIEKGYEFTKIGNEFEVNILDLPLGTSQKVKVLCDFCGEIICKRYNEYINRNINDKDSCAKCKNKKHSKYNIDDIRKEFEKRNFILLENEYINTKTYMRFICDKGHETQITYQRFLKGHGCKECSRIKLGNKMRKTIEEVRKIFEENGCILLSTEYKQASQKLKYICECGNESEITFNHFQSGERCKECGRKKLAEQFKHDYEYVYNIFKDNGCVLLEDEYINGHNTMRYICVCGRESETTLANFMKGARCKQCFADKIRGENHPNWNPYLTDEERELGRLYPEYYQWRKEIFERDNYTCQCCHNRGGKLNAHHLDGYNWCKEKRTDIDNGTTLCFDCHIEFHSFYGKKHVTKEQFEEFIKSKLI
jgi:hypothetical protein